MEITFPSLWRKMIVYLKENSAGSIAFFFLLVVGIAAGMSMMQALYQDMAGYTIRQLPAALQINGPSWLPLIWISFCTHAAFCSMLMLSGLWLPAGILWPAAIVLRGLLTGAGLGACVMALPLPAALLLLIILWMEAALLFPPMLRMSVLSGRQIVSRLTAQKAATVEYHTYFLRMLRCAIWLLPCILIECFITPLLLYLFG